MDLFIRNVNPSAVKKIDEFAKKKKLSRNEFLKHYIETLSVVEVLKKNEQQYEENTKRLVLVIEENSRRMERMEQKLETIQRRIENEHD